MTWSGTDALLAEFGGQGRVVPILNLTLGGDTLKVAERDVASASRGQYLGDLKRMEGFQRRAFDDTFALELPRPRVTIYDRDRTIRDYLGGPARGQVKTSPVAVWWVPTEESGLTSSDHYQDFAGIVTNYGSSAHREWTFELGLASEQALNSQPKIPTLGEDFPTAPAEFKGDPLWIVYGKHASLGVTGATGMINALPAVVDSSGDSIDWVLGYGQLQIHRLWRTISGAMTEDTSNWGFYVLERGGHRYQMGRYTGGGTKPTPDDTVSFDCWGLFQTAPATASVPIENPASVLRNFLANFVLGASDLTAGASWESEAGKPIGTSVLDDAESYFSTRNEVTAKVIRANEKALDVVNGMFASSRMVPFFTDAWAIAAIPEDEGELELFPTGRHIAHARGEIQDESGDPAERIQADTQRSKPLSEFEVYHLLIDAQGTLAESISVADPSQPITVREDLNLEYGDASLIDA